MSATVRSAFLLALSSLGIALGAELLQAPDPTVFHSGTRLVEVEVVVRSERIRPPGVGEWFKWVLDSGPPFGPPGDPLKGLTKDDFTLLDNGKSQPIAVFRAGPSSDATLIPLPPGAVSNRQDSRGQSLNGATAVLVDFLNTGWMLSEYARLGLKHLLRSLTGTDRIALYTLGKNLHALQDFSDDPQKLIDIASELDQTKTDLPPEFANALWDYGDPPTAYVDPRDHPKATLNALRVILQRLSGLPGRKSLVWLGGPASPAIVAMMQRANIVLYPVAVRGGGFAGLESEDAVQAGTASGGRAFFDAMDLTAAVQTAEEDLGTAYVLGYYPPADVLDGKFHRITVKVPTRASNKEAYELHYRSGYLATKVAVPALAPSLAELLEDPIAATGIGLAGQVTPEAQHPGFYDLRVTLDLHDIHLDRKDAHFTGAFDFFLPNPSSQRTVKTGSVALYLTDQQLADALEKGFSRLITGVEPESGEIRVVVRDRSTGIAGSVRIPVTHPAVLRQ
jgi:VWFA-related protein